MKITDVLVKRFWWFYGIMFAIGIIFIVFANLTLPTSEELDQAMKYNINVYECKMRYTRPAILEEEYDIVCSVAFFNNTDEAMKEVNVDLVFIDENENELQQDSVKFMYVEPISVSYGVTSISIDTFKKFKGVAFRITEM